MYGSSKWHPVNQYKLLNNKSDKSMTMYAPRDLCHPAAQCTYCTCIYCTMHILHTHILHNAYTAQCTYCTCTYCTMHILHNAYTAYAHAHNTQ